MKKNDPQTDKNPGKVLRGIRDLEKTHNWKEIAQVLFPKKILPPLGYPSPKHFAWAFHCHLVNRGIQLKETPEDEQTLWECHVWRNAAAAFITNQCPVFFLDKNLTELLENTDPPEDVQPEDLEMPYPCFGLILPETSRWPLLIISETQPEEENTPPDDARRILESIPTSGLGRKNLYDVYFPPMGTPPASQTSLSIIRGKTNGFWAGSFCPMVYKNLRDTIANFENSLKKFYGPKGLVDTESAGITAFALNFLAFLRYEYEPQKKNKPKQRWEEAKKEQPDKKGWHRPILIQEPTEKETPIRTQSPGKGKTPSTHWRRGHWHTVLYGAKKSERTKKWFRPTLVAKNKASHL